MRIEIEREKENVELIKRQQMLTSEQEDLVREQKKTQILTQQLIKKKIGFQGKDTYYLKSKHPQKTANQK